ncbi:MAG: phosphopantothenoylcysteine decarboxylase [Candidatus Rifleibacteriota bacterium]
MNLIITSGGTREKIDGVRSITNFSTGTTGAAIADYFADKKASVTLLHAKGAVLPKSEAVKRVEFISFADLDSQIHELLSENCFDAIIHAAAVSDFLIDFITIDGKRINTDRSKIDSEGASSLSIQLKPSHKIISRLKDYSTNKKITVVGFKLTNTKDIRARVRARDKLWETSPIDLLVYNDLTEIAPERHPTTIYHSSGIVKENRNLTELAENLFQLIGETI